MSEFDPRARMSAGPARTLRAATGEVDQGLRAYMLRVYNLMAVGIGLTGLVAWASANSGLYLWMATQAQPLFWLALLSPLGIVFYLSFRHHAISPARAQTLFWTYAALVGISLGGIALVYTGASIARVFFITAAAFGALSLYGYTTKRDLSPMGTFLMISLFGLIIGLVVNLFLQSPALQFALSAIGVLVFAGLTAWDTQKIKQTYYQIEQMMAPGRAGAAQAWAPGGDPVSELREKAAIMGALRLYLDFLNLFLFLLQFLGQRR